MSDPQFERQPELEERVWESGWQEHEQRQILRLAHLTFSEKLAWLEQADRLVRHMNRKIEPAKES